MLYKKKIILHFVFCLKCPLMLNEGFPNILDFLLRRYRFQRLTKSGEMFYFVTLTTCSIPMFALWLIVLFNFDYYKNNIRNILWRVIWFYFEIRIPVISASKMCSNFMIWSLIWKYRDIAPLLSSLTKLLSLPTICVV